MCCTNLPESFSLESILAEWCVCHQEGSWVRVIRQRQPRNQPNYHKTRDCEPRGRAVLLCSLTLLLSAPPPLPIKPLALSACVSPRTIHFRVLDKSPLSGPGRGPPSCNNSLYSACDSSESSIDYSNCSQIIIFYTLSNLVVLLTITKMINTFQRMKCTSSQMLQAKLNYFLLLVHAHDFYTLEALPWCSLCHQCASGQFYISAYLLGVHTEVIREGDRDEKRKPTIPVL